MQMNSKDKENNDRNNLKDKNNKNYNNKKNYENEKVFDDMDYLKKKTKNHISNY